MSANENPSAERKDSRSLAVRNGFHWLLVPAGIAGAVGLFSIVGNGALLAYRIFGSHEIPWKDVPWRFQIWEVELRVVAMLVGVAFVVAAVVVARRRWKTGAFLAVLAATVAIANPAANRMLRHRFAGDTYTIDGPRGVSKEVAYLPPDSAPSRGAAELLVSPFDGPTAKKKQDEWARRLQKRPIERNSIGGEIVLIPPGEFSLGSSETLAEVEKAFPIIEINNRDPGFKKVIESERPPHKVRITKPFYMGKCNVTVGQFRKFVDDTAYMTEAEKDGVGGWGYATGENPPLAQKPHFNWRTTGFPQTDDHPVVNISWNDAMAFCDWLTKKEGKTYRLPTDAEWEYCCRAGTLTRYSTGDNPDGLMDVGNVADIAYFTMVLGRELPPEDVERGRAMGMMVKGNDRYAFTSPIGKFKPNGFGLFDMHGNASTWCMDWCGVDYYSRSEVDDPRGPRDGSMRIVRGGNWQYYPAFCRSASRFAYSPSRRELFLGLRLVCERTAE